MSTTVFDVSQFHQARVQALYFELLSMPSPLGGSLNQAFAIGHPILNGSLQRLPAGWLARVGTSIRVVHGGDGGSFCETLPGQTSVITINLKGCQAKLARQRFTEYQMIAEDPVIGSAAVVTEDEAILLTLAHELAHAVVAGLGIRLEPPHGATWQAVYRFIRPGLNGWLADRAALHSQAGIQDVEQRVLRKARSLQSMAEHHGSNPHEAERARAQLNSLLQRYRLDVEQLETGAQPRVVQQFVPNTRMDRRSTLGTLPNVVSQVCQCRLLMHSRRKRGATGLVHYVSLIGAADDVDRAIYLLEVIERAIRAEFEHYRKSDEHQVLTGRDRYNARASFHHAMIRSIVEQLWALDTENEAIIEAAEPSAQAVMALKQDQVQSALGQLYPKLGRSSRGQGQSQTGTNPAAAKRGSDAGRRVNLNPGVGRVKGLLLG